MGDIVALVPPPRSRPSAETADARVLLFTGVFRERYDDYAALRLPSCVEGSASASPSAPTRPARSRGCGAPNSVGRVEVSSVVQRAARRVEESHAPAAASAPAAPKRRAPRVGAEDPVIAAILAKVAAQAVAAAARVKAREKAGRFKKDDDGKRGPRASSSSKGKRRA
jgi:hypothetical protein